MAHNRKVLLTDLFIAEIFSKIVHHGAQFREGDKPGRLKGIKNTFNPLNITRHNPDQRHQTPV